jgi:hypothetical protein
VLRGTSQSVHRGDHQGVTLTSPDKGDLKLLALGCCREALTRSRAGSRFVNAYFRAMIFYLKVAAAIVLVGAVGAVVWIMVFAIIAWS